MLYYVTRHFAQNINIDFAYFKGAVPDGQGTSFNDPTSVPVGTNCPSSSSASIHYPPKDFMNIGVPIDLDKVMNKLLEFNLKNEDKFKISDDHLTTLRLLNEEGIKLDAEVRHIINKNSQ